MQVDFDRLNQYHEDGKLRRSVHPTRSLFVWCYSQQTVYSRDWDDLTLMCRGLVTDDQGIVISRPFRKFFNYGEPRPEILGELDLTAPFWAYDKVDGSLIMAGVDPIDGELIVSTKGSFTTWHSEKAREMLGGWRPVEGSTGIFEFVDPDNRIVVDYHGFSGLFLLGAVENDTGQDHFTPDNYADETGWSGEIPAGRAINLQATLQSVANPENGVNREGFVLVWPNPDGPSDRLKIKFAQYLNLHAVLSRISNVAVWEALKDGSFDALIELVPDEMYDQVRECANKLNSAHIEYMMDAHRVLKKVVDLPTRKEQAAALLDPDGEDAKYAKLVFLLLDDRDITSAVWDVIKPERDGTWTFLK